LPRGVSIYFSPYCITGQRPRFSMASCYDFVKTIQYFQLLVPNPV
jgi:hypothetical protein